MSHDEPQWFSRITEISSIIAARTGAELSLNSNRAAPPNGERGPEHLSQSAQASLLTTQFYTLTGGTTNRTLGPGSSSPACSTKSRTLPPALLPGNSPR